jgi:hypothetical protein
VIPTQPRNPALRIAANVMPNFEDDKNNIDYIQLLKTNLNENSKQGNFFNCPD